MAMGLKYQEKALLVLASGILASDAEYAAAMRMYTSGAKLVTLGASAMLVTDKIYEILELGFGAKDLAKLIISRPQLTISALEVQVFKYVSYKLETDGVTWLKFTALNYQSANVSFLKWYLDDWSKTLDLFESSFINLALFIEGEIYD